MNTIWIKHAVTGGVAEVPKDSLPIHRQAGWDAMSPAAVAAMKKAEAAELVVDEPAASPPAVADPAADHEVTPDAVARPSKKENG